MIESARYGAQGGIVAVFDGRETFVPDDMSNRHRQMIAKWEAAGGIIAPYVPPTPPTADEIAENDYTTVSVLVKKVLFDLANKVRVLQGQAPLTQQQFKTYVKGL